MINSGAGKKMVRPHCCTKHVSIRKGPWSPDEDHKLVSYIQKHGYGKWKVLPSLAGLNRCGKSCRLRWINYLRSGINREKFSPQEEQTIIKLHAILGNKWSTIASILPGRTDNDVKNFWNTNIKKKLNRMGINPVTHELHAEAISSHLPDLIAHLANLVEVLAATKINNFNNNNNSHINNNRMQIQQNNKLHFPLHPHLTTTTTTALDLEAVAPPISDEYITNPMVVDDLSSSSFPRLPDLFPHLPPSSTTNSFPTFKDDIYKPTVVAQAQHGGAPSSSTAPELDNYCDFIDSSSYWTALLS